MILVLLWLVVGSYSPWPSHAQLLFVLQQNFVHSHALLIIFAVVDLRGPMIMDFLKPRNLGAILAKKVVNQPYRSKSM